MANTIQDWLTEVGLSEHIDSFLENAIDFELLPHLTNEDLKDLGIGKLGDRKKLLLAIEQLQSGEAVVSEDAAADDSSSASRAEAERRQLTVMFCDLAGSTTLTERFDPEDLSEIVRTYQDCCAGIISRYEGYIARYMGDGILVYFGYPQAHEDDAERAVRTGLEIVGSVPKLEPRPGLSLEVRVGVSTGHVVVGETIGQGSSKEQVVVGKAPNLAARFQGCAKPNTLVIGPTTRQLAGERFEYVNLGAQELRGIADPVQAWQVTRLQEPEAMLSPGADPRGPLVGREHEFRLLCERWATAVGGEGQVVYLSGEPGIGKSRMIEALREKVGRDEATHIKLRCSSYHVHSALYPMQVHLEQVIGRTLHDGPAETFTKIEQLFADYRFADESTVSLFAGLLGISPQSGEPPLPMSPEQQKQQTQAALIAWMAEEAERKPLLMVWEDLHWADPSTVELVGLIIEHAPTTRMLAVLVARPEFKTRWGTRSHLIPITLPRLGSEQVEAITHRVAGGAVLPAEILTKIAESADGVPLFVEEITKSVLESGILRRVNGRYELTGDLDKAAIPITLHDSLMARLDRLGSAKSLAQIAAVVGRRFSYALLREVVPGDEATLQKELHQLIDVELIYPRGVPPRATYVFKHALVQDAAYESLLRIRRKELHKRIAEVLERQFATIVEAEPELVAHHYTEAQVWESAVAYWLRAGNRAVQRAANVEAVAHLTKGLSLLEQSPDTPERARWELSLQVALGPAVMMVRGPASSASSNIYARARALSQQVGDIQQRFAASWGYWHVHANQTEWTMARELADELSDLACQQDDPGLLLQAHHAQWGTSILLGEFTSVLEHTKQGITLYDREQHGTHAFHYGGHDPGACAHQVRVLVLSLLGYSDQAKEDVHKVLALVEALGHPATQALAHTFVALAQQTIGNVEAALAHADSAIAIGRAYNVLPYVLAARVVRGWALAYLERAEEGLSELQQILGPIRAKRRRLPMITCYLGLLADVYRRRDEANEGLEVISEGLEVTAPAGERLWEAELYRLRGELLLLSAAKNRTDDAQRCFQKALDVARQQEARSWELHAATSLSRLWDKHGKRNEACELLAPVLEWFTEGFDTPNFRQAAALLDELA